MSPFTATKPQGSFAPTPLGMHVARCYALIDLGTQPKSYMGESRGETRKVMARWEIFPSNDDGSIQYMEDGRPFSISKSWFLSLHEKASLRKDLESWRGKSFSPEEEAGFDVSKLVGVYCVLNIIEEVAEAGKTYTKIKAINPTMKGMVKPAPVNENFIFNCDEPDMDAFAKFSDKLKDIIRASREWRARAKGASPATTASKTQGSGFDDMPNDFDTDLIPF